jgi:hypothetical protein
MRNTLLIATGLAILATAGCTEDNGVHLGADVGVAVAGDGSPGEVDLNGAFIEEVNGVRILHLFGTSRQRGRARGYLLAAEILELAQRYMFDFALKKMSTLPYSTVRELLDNNTYWPEETVAELEGMLEGIRAKLPPRMLQVTIPGEGTRQVDLIDLKAGSVFGDWTRISGCSGFAAWGKATGGPTIHARNLDYASGDGVLLPYLLVVASTPDKGPRWVSVSHVGGPGCGTCMNEHGLTMEGNNGGLGLPSTQTTEIIGRSILAEMVQRQGRTSTAPTDVVAAYRQHRVYVSQNSLYATPYGDGKPDDQVAAVLESDGNDLESGTTHRKPSETAYSGLSRTDVIIETNHMLKRVDKADPASNSVMRYMKIWERIQASTNATHPDNPTRDATIDATDAQWIMQGVGVSNTILFAIFEPDARRVHVAIQSRVGTPAVDRTVATLTWGQLFE